MLEKIELVYPEGVTIMLYEGVWSLATASMDFVSDKGYWWINRIFIKEQRRRKGHGSSLVADLQNNANGYPIVVVPGGYSMKVEDQRAFYESCGFVEASGEDEGMWKWYPAE